jgi:hypothetical protein
LKQSNNPDEIIDIEFNINSCKKCGYDISNIIAKLKEKRQVLDLELAAIITLLNI